MSKSLGNFFSVPDVLEHYDADTVRFFLVRGHYRSELGWSDKHLDDARAGLKRLYTALHAVPPQDIELDWNQPFAARFKAAMDNDFSTPDAVAALFDLATEVNRTQSGELSGLLKRLGACLGLFQLEPRVWLQGRRDITVELTGVSANVSVGNVSVAVAHSDAEIEQLIAQRAAAKAAKDFAQADSIRKELLAQGIALKDSPTGTTWEAAQ
jgi:cysteinyl-tRNA synthetase